MKYCIRCLANSNNVKIADGFCENCYIEEPKKIVASLLVVKCWKCGEKYSGAQCKCRRNFKEKSSKKYLINELELLRIEKRVLRIKEAQKPPCCKFCLLPETNENPFFTYVSEGHTRKLRKHISCRTKEQENVALKKIKHKQEYYIKNKPPTTSKERGRPRLSDAEKMALLPERKICVFCEKDKHVSEFYFNKKRIIYYKACKICHGKRNKKKKEKDPLSNLIYTNLYYYAFQPNKNRK